MMSIKKIFMATINADHPQKGMLHAFQGVFGKDNVYHYDYMQRMRDTNWGVEFVNREFLLQAKAFNPDWAWLQLQNTHIIAQTTLNRLREELPKCVVSHWMGDIRTEIGDYLSSVCRSTHLTLTSSVGYLPLYERAGAKEAKYLQIGLDWEEDIDGIPDWTPPFQVSEVIFIGNYYGTTFPGVDERRGAVKALMQAGVNVGVVGSGWGGVPLIGSCLVKQQVHVWKRAKVAISVNHFPDVEGYYSDRHLTALVSGTPLVCRYIPGLEREFQNGVHLRWYKTEAELVEIVKELLADEPQRKRLGAAGRAEVIRRHSWFSRILEVLPDIERIHTSLGAT